MMITFGLVPFIPLVVLREWIGFNFFDQIPFYGSHLMWRTIVIPRPSVMLLSFCSIILRVREANSSFLSFLFLLRHWLKACDWLKASYMIDT